MKKVLVTTLFALSASQAFAQVVTSEGWPADLQPLAKTFDSEVVPMERQEEFQLRLDQWQIRTKSPARRIAAEELKRLDVNAPLNEFAVVDLSEKSVEERSFYVLNKLFGAGSSELRYFCELYTNLKDTKTACADKTQEILSLVPAKNKVIVVSYKGKEFETAQGTKLFDSYVLVFVESAEKPGTLARLFFDVAHDI